VFKKIEANAPSNNVVRELFDDSRQNASKIALVFFTGLGGTVSAFPSSEAAGDTQPASNAVTGEYWMHSELPKSAVANRSTAVQFTIRGIIPPAHGRGTGLGERLVNRLMPATSGLGVVS
jgi:hypothetical protein